MKRIAMLPLVSLLACEVTATNTNPQGVDAAADSPGVTPEAGAPDVDAEAGAPVSCPSVLLSVDSDYTSTNISAVSFAGAVLSASLVSSASTTSGTSTPLSGDCVLPHDPPKSAAVVIDRTPDAVLTWVNLSTAMVEKQLSVATGFSSNPHDYLEVSATKAYVTRYDSNGNPGKVPYDTGGDILIVNPATPGVTNHIDLSAQADTGYLPRPDRMTLVGNEAIVLLGRLSADYSMAEAGRMIAVNTSTDAIDWHVDFGGYVDCEALALSPSGHTLAVGCSGSFGGTTAQQIAQSGVLLFDTTQSPFALLHAYPTATTLNAPVSTAVAFASETKLVTLLDGDMATSTNDFAVVLDTTTGNTTPLYTAGAPFTLGDAWCDTACASLCFLADASKNALVSFSVPALMQGASIAPDPTPGLPPRALGAY